MFTCTSARVNAIVVCYTAGELGYAATCAVSDLAASTVLKATAHAALKAAKLARVLLARRRPAGGIDIALADVHIQQTNIEFLCSRR